MSRLSLAIGVGLLIIPIGATIAFFVAPWRGLDAPRPGTSLALAEDRAARVSSVKYDLSLSVPASRAGSIRGRIITTFMLIGADRALAFDFSQPAERLLGVAANGRPVPARLQNGHVLIPPDELVEGTNVVDLEFLAGDEPLNRNDDFLYSLFVPARASLAIPCFDHP